MNRFLLSLGTAPLASALLFAQSSGPQPTGINNGGVNNPAGAWNGLLVASACRTGETSYRRSQNAGSKTPVSGDQMNATAQVVTPPVDSLNTRGSAPVAPTSNANQTYEQVQNHDDRTGPVDSAQATTPAAQALTADERAFVRNMDDNCRIRQNTSTFELRLPDGRMVAFDNAGNTQIQELLQSGNRLEHKKKVFRVHVEGTMRAGALHLDRIQM